VLTRLRDINDETLGPAVDKMDYSLSSTAASKPRPETVSIKTNAVKWDVKECSPVCIGQAWNLLCRLQQGVSEMRMSELAMV
jgi:hypothetical protein